jgi:coproporphyrinogen III oxidase-like Fe-S oxidoreductase
VDVEPPEPRRALAERLMMGVRLAEGLGAAELLAAAGALGKGEALRGAVVKQIDAGLMEERAGRWTLTARGFLQCDGVAGELMGAVG